MIEARAMPTKRPEAPDLSTLAGRLRYARELRGMSARALCARAGLSIAAVDRIEHERHGGNARIATIEALARALGVEPDWLAWRKGTDPT